MENNAVRQKRIEGLKNSGVYERRCIANTTQEFRKKISVASKKMWSDILMRQKMSEIKKDYYLKNPEAKQKISEATKLAMANPEIRDKLSIAQKKRFSNPEEAKRMREILDPIVKSKEFAETQRQLTTQKWQNPEYVKNQKNGRNIRFSKPEERSKMKEISNEMWNDPKKYKSTLEKRSNVSKEQVEKILSLKNSGLNYRQISLQVGCNMPIVGRICRGENKFALLE